MEDHRHPVPNGSKKADQRPFTGPARDQPLAIIDCIHDVLVCRRDDQLLVHDTLSYIVREDMAAVVVRLQQHQTVLVALHEKVRETSLCLRDDCIVGIQRLLDGFQQDH